MTMDCRSTVERLTRYVDGTLPATERAGVDQHLGACPPCRVAAAGEQNGRELLRDRADRLRDAPLPPGLRSRCEALVREHAEMGRLKPAPTTSNVGAGFSRPAWHTRLVPISLTAVLVLFVAVALFSLATYRSETLLAAQLTADHSKCFALSASGDAHADAAAVEEMLADRHGWDVHVPPSSPGDGVQLIGARRCLYADGRVPHLMYRAGGRDVSLYMLEGVTRPEADLVTFGHRSRVWSRGATTFVLVWPEDAENMAPVLRYIMREAR